MKAQLRAGTVSVGDVLAEPPARARGMLATELVRALLGFGESYPLVRDLVDGVDQDDMVVVLDGQFTVELRSAERVAW